MHSVRRWYRPSNIGHKHRTHRKEERIGGYGPTVSERDEWLIGGPEARPVEIADHRPEWTERFEIERAKIAEALPHAIAIEHVGSTSVPGLGAKPIVDIQVEIDGLGETRDIPPLEAAGYVLRVREANHLMVRTPERDVHVHLWAEDHDLDRHLLFRDWLRTNEADRAKYEAVKRELATRTWRDMNDYADAKSDVINEITARAEAWASTTGWRRR